MTIQFPSVPTSPGFRNMWFATTVSEFGDWSARLAIAALVFAQTGDERLVGLVSVVFVAPRLGVGQLLTSWSERFPRRPLLVAADSARAALFLILAFFAWPAVAVLALVLLAATLDPVFQSNAAAATFDLLTDEDRDDGVRLRQITNLLAQVGGIGLTGVLLAFVEPRTVLLINAISFTISALLVAQTPLARTAATTETILRTLATAAKTIARQAHIRAALLTTMATIFAATAAEAQVIVLVDGQPDWVLPAAGAAIPICAALAILVASTEGGTRPVLRQSLVITTLSMVIAVAALQVTAAWAIVVAFAGSGFMFVSTVAGQVVAVRHLPVEGRASVLSLLQTAVVLAAAAGAAVSGFAISWLGAARGIQLCLLVALVAWLVPLPDEADPEIDTSEPVQAS